MNPLGLLQMIGGRDGQDMVNWGRIYLINNGRAALNLLKMDDKEIRKGDNLELIHHLIGRGLLLLQTEEHKTRRNDLHKFFNKNTISSSYIIDEIFSQLPITGQLLFPAFTNRVFLKLICNFVFNNNNDDLINQFDKLSQKTLRISTYAAWLSIINVYPKKILKYKIDLLYKEWENIILYSKIGGYIDFMKNLGLPKKDIIHEVITAVLAGHETTSAACSWIVLLVSQHNYPTKFSEKEDDLKMVIRESLRLYPPAWVFYRTPIVDIELDERVIPKGSIILISPYLIHRNRSDWGNDSNEFNPNRDQSQSFIPFSSGHRSCIGARMASNHIEDFIKYFYGLIEPIQINRIKTVTRITLYPSYSLKYRKK